MSTVVLAMNEKDTLSTATAVADLHAVIVTTDPDLGVLQEWPKSRDAATRQMLARIGYGYGRPDRGGGPAIWRLDRYRLHSIHAVRLVGSELVGHLPGRRDRLGPSWATLAILDDLRGVRPDGEPNESRQTALIGYHFTAEVQDVRGGGGYKTEAKYALRVRRHKREKRALGRLGRKELRRPRKVLMGGDSNFTGMVVGGFENCWDGHRGGDLGGRPVTIVYAAEKPERAPETVKTKSDHLAVVVTYP